MKTTLIIDEQVMIRLREEAARRQKTISELVEGALRLLLEDRANRRRAKLPPLPAFQGGRPVVDVANREALYHAMEGR